MSNYLKTVRTTSIKAVVGRVLELIPKDSISEDKLEEWAYQSYESIASREVYEVHAEFLEVRNHTAPLPIGLFQLEMVLYKNLDFSGTRTRTNPYTTETSDFNTTTEILTNQTTDTFTTTTITTDTTSTNVHLNTGMDTPVYTYDADGNLVKEQLYYNNQFGKTNWRPLPLSTNVFHNSVLMGAPSEIYGGCNDSFSVQNGCIVTSFSEGMIAIAYTGLPTDEEGDFVIPDYEEVKAALECYMLKNYFKWKMNTGNVNGAQSKYQMYGQEYEYLAPKASAFLMMPDLIQYQNIRNMNKFIKEDSPFATILGALNNKETMEFNNPRLGSKLLHNYVTAGFRR